MVCDHTTIGTLPTQLSLNILAYVVKGNLVHLVFDSGFLADQGSKEVSRAGLQEHGVALVCQVEEKACSYSQRDC